MQMLPLALLTPYFRIRRHIYTWKCIVCLVTLLPSSHTFKCLISIIFRLFSSFHIGLVAHRMKRNFFFGSRLACHWRGTNSSRKVVWLLVMHENWWWCRQRHAVNCGISSVIIYGRKKIQNERWRKNGAIEKWDIIHFEITKQRHRWRHTQKSH